MTSPTIAGNSGPRTWLIFLAFAALYISWGTTYLAIREGVQDFPPCLFGGFRLGGAGLIILAYLAWRGERFALPWRDVGWTILVSNVMFIGGNGLLSIAETTMESATAAVLGATTPLWMALIEVCWPGGERLTGRGWLGLLMGFLGVVFMFGGSLQDPAALLRDAGPFLMMGSAFTWGLGTVMSNRRRPGCSLIALAGHQLVLGGLGLLVTGLVLGEGSSVSAASFTPRAVISFLYLLVVGSLIGFVAFTWLMGHVRTSLVGTYSYVNPCVAVLVGWLVASETVTFEMLGGMLCILAAVALVRSAGAHVAVPANDAQAAVTSPILLACTRRSADNQACRES